MTTIISNNYTVPPGKTATPQKLITITSPPQSLIQLPPGSLINATAIINSTDENTKIDSIFGRLTIKTALEIPDKSSLELQLLRSEPELKLALKTVNGADVQLQIPEKTTNQVTKSGAQLSGASENHLINTTPRERETIKLDIGAQIIAVLLTPNTNGIRDRNNPSSRKSVIRSTITMLAKSQAHSSRLITENEECLIAKESSFLKNLSTAFRALTEISNKNLISPPTTNKIKNTGLLQQIQSVFGKRKPKDAPVSSPLQSGTRLLLNFIGTKDNLLPNNKIFKSGRDIVRATVVAKTPSRQPILNTPLGMMIVETKVSLKIGLILQLEVVPEPITMPISSSPTTRFKAIYQSIEWLNLLDAIHELNLVEPQVSQKFVNTTIAQPNSQLASNILFFLNALKSRDISSWIGNNATSRLAQIQPQLLTQLNEDFAVLSRANMDPQPSEWRTAIIPFLTTMGLDQFHLHTQDQSRGENTRKADNSSRFIVDIALSRIGRIQLDGFLRKKRKRLDLIVRVRQALPKQMRAEISTIFRNFSEISKISGQITFQINQNFIEIPIPQLTDNPNSGVVV